MSTSCGDCEDTAALACSMLNAIGVDAYPVTLSTRGDGQMPLDIPCPATNHVIVLIKHGNQEVFFETTSDPTPWNQLSRMSSGRNAYVTQGKELRLIVTPEVTRDSAEINDDVTFIVPESGPYRLQLTRTYHGLAASDKRQELWPMSGEERRESLTSVMEDYYDGFQTESFHLSKENLFNPDEPLTIEMELRNPSRPMSVKLSSIHAWPSLACWLDIKDNRPVPWSFGSPVKIKETIEIQVPKSMQVSTSQENFELTSKWGEARRTFTQGRSYGESASIVFELSVNETTVVPEEVVAFRQFRNRLKMERSDSVVLELSPRAMVVENYRKGNFALAVTIGSMWHTQDSHPTLLSALSMSHYKLGNKEEAEKFFEILISKMERDEYKGDDECKASLDEAKQVFAEPELLGSAKSSTESEKSGEIEDSTKSETKGN